MEPTLSAQGFPVQNPGPKASLELQNPPCPSIPPDAGSQGR